MSAVKSGAEDRAEAALGVWVAMRVYAGMEWSRWEKDVSVVFQTLTVSASSPTSSSRCVVRARPSVSRLSVAEEEAGEGPTRSVMSKMMLVKPSLSM